MSSLGSLAGHRIVPVIVIDDAAQAADLARALAAGGIECAEVTFRTPAAAEAIRAMAEVPGFTVGAGSVVRPDQFEAARQAGASFIVSPGYDPEIVDLARDHGLGSLPGIATATEALVALRAGIDTVKFFPADKLGGLATIRALAAPLQGLGFVPSGGVTVLEAPTYLADAAVPAVSGSWMATRAMIASGDFATIERVTAESVQAIGRI